MSQKRQVPARRRSDQRRAAITTFTRDYAAGQVVTPHQHRRDQLVFAARGVMTVRAKAGAWVVPTNRAVWIPAGIRHDITMCGVVAMRTLYFEARLARGLPRECIVVNVLPLLRELILRACGSRTLDLRTPRQRHLIAVILDQLETIQTIPLRLPNPTDPRALRVTRALMDPSVAAQPLSRICALGGASKRTVERLFQREVAMSVGKWRQQLRLLRAMQLLAQGAKVTHAALEAGYSTPSAFISMFRRTLGSTPAAYFRAAA